MISTEQALAHWQLIVGAAVLLVAPLLIGRAWRRIKKRRADAQQKLDEDTLREIADRRGRRVEDILTLAVASAAAYLSSTGLRKFGRDMMDLAPPLDWLPFIALDMAAVVCGQRARRRAGKGESPGLSGMLVWIFIAVSATFSAAEAKTPAEALARAVWPVIAGVLFELGSLEKRREAKQKERRRLGQWLNRKLSAIRLLHPVEWVRVQLALAADETISQEEATRRVRIERAGYRFYRLRQLGDALKDAGRLEKFFLALPLREAGADRRAQVTQARVHTRDLRLVLEAVQRRVQTRTFANLSYRTADAAERALASLIDTGTDTDAEGRTGTNADTDTDAAREMESTRTDTDSGSVSARTGTPVRDTASVSEGGTGTDTGEVEPVSTGTAPREYRRTARAGTGEHPAKPRAVQPVGTENRQSDEELVERLRRTLRPDGTFGTGGKARTGRALGIGTGRAGRLMDEARELGPLPSLTGEVGSQEDAETGTDIDADVETGTGADAEQAPEDALPVEEAGTPDQAPAIDLDKAFPIAPRLARPVQRPARELAGVTAVNGTPTV